MMTVPFRHNTAMWQTDRRTNRYRAICVTRQNSR